MHGVIQHRISDPVKGDHGVKDTVAMRERHRLPGGIKPLQYLPSAV